MKLGLRRKEKGTKWLGVPFWKGSTKIE